MMWSVNGNTSAAILCVNFVRRAVSGVARGGGGGGGGGEHGEGAGLRWAPKCLDVWYK